MRNGYSYRITRTIDPAAEPMTTADAKTHLKIDGSDEDTYIDGLIKAARQMAEEETNRSFITQTWKLYFDDWPEGDLMLPRGIVQSVTSVQYYDSNGSLQAVSSDDYNVSLEDDIGRIRTKDVWPTVNTDHANSIVVEYVAGYGNASTDIPEGLIQAIKIIVADLHNFRQSYTKQAFSVLPNGKPFYQLHLDPYKIYF